MDFPEFNLPDLVQQPSPSLVPQCHHGNRGKVGRICASSGCAWMALEEKEACSRRCIAEPYVAVLELLVQDFFGRRGCAFMPPLPRACIANPPRTPIGFCESRLHMYHRCLA